MINLGRRAYSSLRSATPGPLRRPLASAIEQVGVWTSPLRLMPSFIILGGQRCGTNSLYEYLVRHPNVLRAMPGQEVHYFDFNFHKGSGWYRGHFPTKVRGALAKSPWNLQLITGECSPYYMFHPLSPERIAQLLPEVKLFVLLRNPVDRAYSHYQHERKRGIEELSFEEAIAAEPERLNGEVDKILEDPRYYSFNHHHFSYLSRGLYITQLERLISLFPRQNLLVLISEQFFSDPVSAHAKAIAFLGLPPHRLPVYTTYNPGRYTSMDPDLRKRLKDHFAEANECLYRLLDTDYRWN
jgi:hypothetical protein